MKSFCRIGNAFFNIYESEIFLQLIYSDGYISAGNFLQLRVLYLNVACFVQAVQG